MEKITMLNGDRESKTLTIQINDENHTLGNCIAYALSLEPNLEFSGYTMPHPSKNSITIRIQSLDLPAYQVLTTALNNIKKMADMLNRKFREACENNNIPCE
ncbi:DNA-directed RNA polymerase I subunit D [Intoshia linei]|uniref:DNA-directed RNA polymerase I subunit D n=1 Tax=Intoshia linei TaxID=1819745 RepID=A0A177B5Y8_9BILA|nr:DNA-directed RNA polymerase I subunit D [Intoshia linei]